MSEHLSELLKPDCLAKLDALVDARGPISGFLPCIDKISSSHNSHKFRPRDQSCIAGLAQLPLPLQPEEEFLRSGSRELVRSNSAEFTARGSATTAGARPPEAAQAQGANVTAQQTAEQAAPGEAAGGEAVDTSLAPPSPTLSKHAMAPLSAAQADGAISSSAPAPPGGWPGSATMHQASEQAGGAISSSASAPMLSASADLVQVRGEQQPLQPQQTLQPQLQQQTLKPQQLQQTTLQPQQLQQQTLRPQQLQQKLQLQQQQHQPQPQPQLQSQPQQQQQLQPKSSVRNRSRSPTSAGGGPRPSSTSPPPGGPWRMEKARQSPRHDIAEPPLRVPSAPTAKESLPVHQHRVAWGDTFWLEEVPQPWPRSTARSPGADGSADSGVGGGNQPPRRKPKKKHPVQRAQDHAQRHRAPGAAKHAAEAVTAAAAAAATPAYAGPVLLNSSEAALARKQLSMAAAAGGDLSQSNSRWRLRSLENSSLRAIARS